MSGQIDATIHTVRRIATELRPGVLDSLGLAAAIEWQGADFQERTGIQCEVKIDVMEPIHERDFSTACFRIFQETLTNIIRHAHATRVKVHLEQEDRELIQSVVDLQAKIQREGTMFGKEFYVASRQETKRALQEP